MVHAVAFRNRSRTESFAEENGSTRAYDSYEDVLGDDELDAVYVPLPNGLHATWPMRATDKAALLCEKSLASDASEALGIC